MQTELKNPTPSLAGGTELLVLAPLRKGLVPSIESMSYKTRTKLLLATLHSGRRSAHEYQLFRALSDAVERVGVIHTVRVTVLEPQDQVLLSVNFDGAYESYVRLIWQKAARLLDLIFCNTENYPLGWRSPFPVWREWLRSVQVETPFFYAPPGQTYQDHQYLRTHEHRQRRDGDDLALAMQTVPSAERIAWDIVRKSADPSAGVPAQEGRRGLQAGIRQGLQGLAGIYRLADTYPPGTDDGDVLLEAAHELLPEFSRLQTMPQYLGSINSAGIRLRQQLAWFRQPRTLPRARIAPQLQAAPALPLGGVQGGVLHPYDDVSHGCLCLVSLEGPAAAAALLQRLQPSVTLGDSPLKPGSVTVNLGFTAEGLRCCGMDDAQLALLPPEFRQGMDARAGLLGDLRHNHPRRWVLPQRNWPDALNNPAWPAPDDTPRIAPQAVHVVLQLRWVAGPGLARHAEGESALAARAHQLLDGMPGVRPLSVQWLARVTAQGDTVDHFGFTDGQSQPTYHAPPPGQRFANQVHPGEVLVGQDNAADHATDLPENQHPEQRALLRDGSFLVLRKLRQNLGVLRQAVDKVAGTPGLGRAAVLAKMMGRWPVGHALAGLPLVDAPAGQPNDFDYSQDQDGAQCPFSAHIRLANPRETLQTQPVSPAVLASIPGARPPRIVRRSMPYGPAAPAWPAAKPATGPATPAADDGADRGLVFMAYNASIAEQFEVVQRWLAGGNSSGMVSAHADPFLGVSQPGRQRHFRFVQGQDVVRMALDGSEALDAEPTPIVKLQWGFYLFTPATSGLAWLHQRALAAKVSVPWSAIDGEREIARLQALAHAEGEVAAAAAWKLALEDLEAVAQWRSASVWAAIRQFHSGALRTPHGVLVASDSLVDEVLSNISGRYTVQGYQERLIRHGIGPIYLGMDDGADYRHESRACNDAIAALDFEHGFNTARVAAQKAIDDGISHARDLATLHDEDRWELLLDTAPLIDSVLAAVTEAWFGLSSDTGHFAIGGFDWVPFDPETSAPDLRPRYPGHFTAFSRATFQPAPGPSADDLARRHGQAVRTAMLDFLTQQGATIQAPVTRAVLDDCGPDLDRAARTISGALMGMLPTTGGNLRRILLEWLRDGTLWQLHGQHAAAAGWDRWATAMSRLHKPLMQTMQARPVPEQIWRRAVSPHSLQSGAASACPVQAGDRIVLGLVSATQQRLESDTDGVMAAFGGIRNGAGSPTHACPGYRAAIGMIVGLLAEILRRPEALRPGPAGGVLAFEGPVVRRPPDEDSDETEAPDNDPDARLAGTTALTLRPATAFALRWKRTPATQGALLGCGDSWIYNDMLFTRRNLGEALADLGWDTSAFEMLATAGGRLRELAAAPADTAAPGTIYRAISDALVAADRPMNPKPLPRAILVSAGGNDLHQTLPGQATPALFQMLNSAAAVAADEPLFTREKDIFIGQRLAGDLHTLLTKLSAVTRGRIPVVVLGYDHPVPDKRGYLNEGPWLHPVISGKLGHTEAVGRQIMRTLIDDLNIEYARVAAGLAGQNVHHVQLTGVLAAQPGYASDYTRWWGDELHPTVRGFNALARELLRKLPAVLPPAVAAAEALAAGAADGTGSASSAPSA
ncbi:MAG: hypothetical protein QE285_18780 [Aquabacterium sp.]|nr:hypothetical protein [Aquabacterium sp.]